MQTIEMDLARLVASGIISFETAAEVERSTRRRSMAQAATHAFADAGAGDGRRRPGGHAPAPAQLVGV